MSLDLDPTFLKQMQSFLQYYYSKTLVKFFRIKNKMEGTTGPNKHKVNFLWLRLKTQTLKFS